MSRFVRGLGALAVLAAVVVGAPWLLWQVGRTVLPDHVPRWTELWETLTSRDAGGTFIGLLVVIGAIAWAVFVLCLLLEIVARVGGRRRAWRIPGLRLPQKAASGLISAVVVGVFFLAGQGPAMAATVAPAPAPPPAVTAVQTHTPAPVGQKPVPAPGSSSSSHHHHQLQDPVGVGGPVASTRTVDRHPVVMVKAGDSLWALAKAHLGDPLRYKEIADLNVGVRQPDGRALHSADEWLEAGWTLRLPMDASGAAATPALVGQKSVTVRQGDTLSGIAERELGDATRYVELTRLNGLTDPDLLEVGQVLQIPGHLVAGAPAQSAHPQPSQSATKAGADRKASQHKAATDKTAAQKASAERDAAEKAAAASAAEQKASAERDAAEKAATARVAAEWEAAQERAAAEKAEQSKNVAQTPAGQQPPAAGAAVGQNHTAAAEESSSSSTILTAAGLGMVLAGAVWGGLQLRRRRQGSRRKLGQQPAPVSLPAARVEQQLRQQASLAGVERLEQVLRTMSVLAESTPVAELPDVMCGWLSSEGLHLRLAAEVPVLEPFEATGQDWWLPAATDLPAADWTEAVAPYPALASIGAIDGESVLVDLEQLGAVRVTGDPGRIQGLYWHLAVELAHSTWSDDLAVTLVGWGADLVALNPDRVAYVPDLESVVRRLRGRIERSRESEASLGTSVLGGRMGDVAGEIWSPQVLLVAAPAADDATVAELDNVLGELAENGRATVAVVATGSAAALSAGSDLSIDESGWLTCPTVLGDQRIRAAAVDEVTLTRILELFTATEVQQEAPPATESEPWAVGMAASGALLEEEIPAPGLDRNTELVVDVSNSNDDAQPAADQLPPTADAAADPVQQVPAATAGGVVPLRSVSPAVAARLESVLSSDPALDADVSEWYSPDVTRPRVAILGAPEVRSAGPDARSRVRCTEIVVYLALHRQVTMQKFEADLWAEDRQPSAATRRWWLSTIRTWLGVDEQERPWLAPARQGVQQLADRLLDLDLMRRLRKRGEAWAAAGDLPRAYADLAAAMRLVRGPVLQDAPPDAYAFMALPDRGEDQCAPLWVAQTAHLAVETGLRLGELDGARAAAEIAHRVAPDEDAPLRDLVAVAQQAGHQSEARGWAEAILRAHRAEYIEDIEDLDTMLFLSKVFPQGLQAG